MAATDQLGMEIEKLETLQDLLSMSNKSGMIDHHGLSSLLLGIVDGLKEVQRELDSEE